MENAGKAGDDYARRSEATARRVGIALAAAGAAVTALGVKSIKAAAEFDTSMREVNTLLELPQDRFAELKQSVIDLDPALGSTTELVGGLYQTISAGIGNADDLGTSLDFIETAATAAKAGLADVDTAVLAGSKTLQGFNLEASESTRVFDVMFQTVRQGQTNFQDLATVAGDLAATAGVLNISLEENFGALAQLTLTAGSTAQAATQLDGIMRALIKPTEAMQAAVESLGFANGEAAIESLGLEGALREIIGTTDGTSVEIGKLFSRAEGLRGVLSLMQNDFSGLNSQIAGMGDASGAAAEAFEEIRKSAGEQFEELRNRLERLVITIGDKLLPFALKLVGAIETVVEWFMNLGSTSQTVIVALTGIGGVLATIAGAVLTLAGPVGSLVGLLGGGAAGGAGLAGAFTSVGGAGAALVGVLTGPVGIAIAIGVVATAIASFIASEGGAFENWIAGTKESIAEITGGVTDFAAEFDRIKPSIDGVNALADQFRQTMPEITAAISESVAAGEAYDSILVSLQDRFKEGTAEGDALRAAMVELAAENSRTAIAAAEAEQAIADLEAAEVRAQDKARELAKAQAELDAALSASGFTTMPAVNTELGQLEMVTAAGIVPTEQLRNKVEELRDKYRELGLLTGDVRDRLDEVTAALDRQDAAAGVLLTNVPAATNAMDLFGGSLDSLPPKIQTNAFAYADMITNLTGLTTEQGHAVAAFAETEAEAIELAKKLRGEYGPAIQASTERMLGLTEASAGTTKGLGDFFGGLKTGIPVIDGFLGKIGGFLDVFGKIGGLFSGGGGEGGGGGIGGFFSGLFGGIKDKAGGFFDSIKGLFSGGGGEAAGGFLGGLQGILGKAASFVPIVGPLLSAFGGPLIKGIGALGKKIGGFFKGLFGGPSGAELEARKTANALNDVFRDMVDSGTAAAEGLTETWQFNNVAQRDIILAMGGTIDEVEATWRRFQDAAKDPNVAAEFDAYWRERLDIVQGVMQSTGLSITDVRDLAINSANIMGISVAEAFQMIADGAITSTQDAQDALAAMNAANTADVQAASAEQTKAVQNAATEQEKAIAMARDAHIAAERDKVAAAAAATQTMTSTVTTGLRTIEGSLESISSTGFRAFESISDSAGMAVDDAIEEFERLQTDLVGASIIPDTVSMSNAEILTIGDAAEQAAKAAAEAFRTTSLSDGIEQEIAAVREALKTAEGDERRRLDQRLDELEAKRRGGRVSVRRGRGGGDDGAEVLRRFGGDGPDGGAGGDRYVFNIHINGAGDPAAVADKVLKEIGKRAARKGIRVSAVT